MSRTRRDQAEGLRRLLDGSGLRVLSISAGAGGGAAAAVVNLAGALAETGSDVLILDAHPGAGGVSAALGLKPRFDLTDVVGRRRDLDEVIVRGPAGILILPLLRGALSLTQLPASDQQALVERCARLGFPVDTLLVNSAWGDGNVGLETGIAAREVIVLAGSSADSITAAYVLIKRLANEFARREFHVLVSDVASEGEARRIFANMSGVARRHLQVSLDFLGYVPPDDKLLQAARLRLPVVAAFPGAAAAASFRRLAQIVAAWPRADAEDGGIDHFMRRLFYANPARAAAA